MELTISKCILFGVLLVHAGCNGNTCTNTKINHDDEMPQFGYARFQCISHCLNTLYQELCDLRVNYYNNGAYYSNDMLSCGSTRTSLRYNSTNAYQDFERSLGYQNCAQDIISLEITGVDLIIMPRLIKMLSLTMLNVSHNLLTIAKLSNEANLPLTNLDLSYNEISTIVLDENEHIYKKLENLNLSHNQLTSLPDLTFDPFKELTLLDLSHNLIDSISLSTFEGIKLLTDLLISHNMISTIDNAFFRFSKLKTLDISHNYILAIKSSDFSKLNNLKHLDLSSNYINAIDDFSFSNFESLETVDLHKNRLSVINTEVFANVTTLKAVDMSQNNLKVFPLHFFKGNNIKTFSLEGNHLEGPLLKGIFDGFGLDTELVLSNQLLTTVEDFVFQGLTELTELFLDGNKIQLISNNSFRTLINLVKLDLSHNYITDINFICEDLRSLATISLRNNRITRITQVNFQNVHVLEFLDLSNNHLSNIDPNSFMSLRSLVNLDISKNPINGILVEKTFFGLSSLPILDISSTQLVTINNGSFKGLSVLTELNVSHSNISDLQFNSFVSTGSIEILDLSFNHLTIFEVNTTELVNLKKLLLNNNLIKFITETSFLKMVRLSFINLSYNNISFTENQIFRDQKDLLSLDLSYNPYMKFVSINISSNQQLKYLNLSGDRGGINFLNLNKLSIATIELAYSVVKNVTELNLNKLKDVTNLVLRNNIISSLEVSAFSNMSDLQQLDLSYNNITTIQPSTFKTAFQLSNLNLSHNAISSVSYGIFKGLIHLETLDLSYNMIVKLESARFYELHKLRTLIVDYNHINVLRLEAFLHDVNHILKTLSVGGNPLLCETLLELNQNELKSFTITALVLDEHHENINGITCNMDGFSYEKKAQGIKHEYDNNHNEVLANIRDILIKIANDKTVKENDISHSFNFTSQLEEISGKHDRQISNLLNHSMIALEESKQTNSLLDKLIKSIYQTYSTVGNRNLNSEDYLNTTKQSQQEMGNNVSHFSSQIQPLDLTNTSPEKLSAVNESNKKSLIFIETCVALILIILVCLLLHKFYKSRLFTRTRRTYSTSVLPGAMECPDL